MKLFPFVSLLVLSVFLTSGCSSAAAAASASSSSSSSSLLVDPTRSYAEWLEYHHGHDSSSAAAAESESYILREQIWMENQKHVEAHNDAFERGYTLYAKTMRGPFADLTDFEFKRDYLMESQDCSATHSSSGRLRPSSTTSANKKKPLAIDWRTKGILTPVKNQGKCGSCWTFSTSGCLESHVCLQANKDCTHWSGLAEEQLVECAGDYNNHGCNGGLPSHAYQYLKENGGMALEKDYPYVAPKNGGKNACSLDTKTKNGHWKAKVAEVYNITTRDENDLVHAIATIGPVSIAYQVSPDFRFYSHGIYDSYNHTTNTTMCKSGQHDVNHAVVAVGLGTSTKTNETTGKIISSTDYYIVRNSWSADWGMEGHFWIKRGENLCGISDCASFPIVPVTSSDDAPPQFLNNNLSTTAGTGAGQQQQQKLLLRKSNKKTE